MDDHLVTPKFKTNCAEQTIRIYGALLWMNLPISLTEPRNAQTFRENGKNPKHNTLKLEILLSTPGVAVEPRMRIILLTQLKDTFDVRDQNPRWLPASILKKSLPKM